MRDLADQGDYLVSLRAMVSYGFQRCSVWKLRSTGEADVFVGKEEGSALDGPVTACLKQPMGIAPSLTVWCMCAMHKQTASNF